jgi:hypothetical protein
MYSSTVLKTVLKQVHSGLCIGHDAIEYTGKLIQHNILQPFINNTDITIDAFKNFLNTNLSGLLLHHALIEGNKSNVLIINKKTNKRLLKKLCANNDVEISENTNIFIISVIEYLIAEIIETAGFETINVNKTNIKIKHIKKGIEYDKELSHAFIILDF